MKHNKETNLEEIKEISKLICKSVPIEPLLGGIITSHPFTNTCNWYNSETGEWLDLTNKDGFNKWTDILFNHIDEAEDVWSIYFMVNIPYKLAMIKYWKDDLCLEDFTKLFKDAWIISENPNDDINVPIRMIIKWFKEADKKSLMTKEELKVFNSLPDEFTIYRGVGHKRKEKGLSWTLNKDTAEWFMNRYEGKNNHVLTAKVKKENCLAYFNSRGENEIVVDVNNLSTKPDRL